MDTRRNPARRLTPVVLLVGALAAIAAFLPLVLTGGEGAVEHTSVRGEVVVLHGYGPYRHMPAEIAVQGFAQDVVTLAVGIPMLILTLMWARQGSRAGHIALSGTVGYLLVQYFMYLGMATYNELFLLWVVLVLLSFQVLVRLLLAAPLSSFVVKGDPKGPRRYVGVFLVVNGLLITMLWLSAVVPPLVSGELYPAGLAHFTTMIVQGFDLALFLPPSVLAGLAYLRRRESGALLAPVYTVFLSLQMTALLAKIVWMHAIGVSAGPALVVIPLLLVGALAAARLSLRPHWAAGCRARPLSP